MTEKRAQARRIVVAMNRIDAMYAMISRALGSRANTAWLLYALDDGQPHSQKQLCGEWLFTKTTLNTTVKRCEAAGYITLEAIPGRRHELALRMTEAGRGYARQLLDEIYRIEEEALDAVGEPGDFLATLEGYADRICVAGRALCAGCGDREGGETT